MAATKGINSYVSVEEAEAYFTDRLDADGWKNADPVRKWQSLVTATTMLDARTWNGIVLNNEQSLAFPRVAEYFDPRQGTIVYLDGTIVPKRIITATFEQALHLLNNSGLQDDTGGVVGLGVAGITLNTILNANKFPHTVESQVRPLLLNGGANPWWRAN